MEAPRETEPARILLSNVARDMQREVATGIRDALAHRPERCVVGIHGDFPLETFEIAEEHEEDVVGNRCHGPVIMTGPC